MWPGILTAKSAKEILRKERKVTGLSLGALCAQLFAPFAVTK